VLCALQGERDRRGPLGPWLDQARGHILGALGDAELSVLDHYTQNNPSAEFTQERDRLRAEIGDVNDDE
jgi:hypothetical protein